MKRTILLRLSMCVAGATAVLVSIPAHVWARPLPSDPRVLVGQLDNGVRWMYRQHGNPPGRMALMMHVRTGSLNETDSQRGLAHFLEHMVFNGTEHFAPGELIPYFESIGMEFGGDLNASTSFERTGYSINLPNTDPAQVEKALIVLSDYAFRALLTDKEIDEERGVILEEARSKKSPSQRIRDQLLPQLYAGSRFAQRMPIGDEQIVATAPREEFINYYRTWYQPENITLMIVGDADPAPYLPLIEKWFGNYKPDRPVAKPLKAEFKPLTDSRVVIATDPELASCTVQVCGILPGRPAAVTVEQWRDEILERMAGQIVTRRCDERIRKGEAAYREAEVSIDDLLGEAVTTLAAAGGETAHWSKMLQEIIVEVRRAREFGFTPREVDLACRDMLASAERACRTESTTNAGTVVSGVFSAVNELRPVMSAQQRFDLLKELLPTLTAAEVGRVFKERFAGEHLAYILIAKQDPGVPGEQAILEAAQQAWALPVERPTQEDTAASLLATLPSPVPVTDVTVDDDLGVTHAWLPNGIRVHHRFMDDKKDAFMLSINLAGGGIEETPDNLGITLAASLAITNPATSRLSSTQMRDLQLGKNIKIGGGPVEDDSFSFRMGGSPAEAEFGLQLIHALMTDGRIEPAALDKWRTETLREIERNETNVSARAIDALNDLLSGGDPRRHSLQAESVEKLKLDEVQAWFDRVCRKAPIEVAVVGDIKWDDIRPLIERYLGSLPARDRSAAHLDPLRKLARQTGPLSARVEVPTLTPTAIAYVGFVGAQGVDIADRRALQIAENILSSRLTTRIREELALVYGMDVRSQSGWVYADSGIFRAGSKCKPENADRVAKETHAVLQAFAEQGPTVDELAAARKQVLNNLDVIMRDPRYWVDLLEHLDLRGRSLDEARTHKQQYAAITAEQVRQVFRKYYTPTRMFTTVAVPSSASTETLALPPQNLGSAETRPEAEKPNDANE